MCTAIVLSQTVPDYPLLVGFNRDERYQRISTPPLTMKGKLKVLAPKDIKSNGSWIGVNSSDFLVAVINYNFGKSCGYVSRGPLVVRILKEYKTAEETIESINSLNVSAYRSSLLLLASSNSAYVVTFTKQPKVEKLPKGTSILTEIGINSARSARTRYLQSGLPNNFDDFNSALFYLKSSLSEHSSTQKKQYTTCCHSRLSGTLSSCIIGISAYSEMNQFLYSDGAPCKNTYQSYKTF